MFTWLNKQGVQSDSGFIVQRTGRFTAEYREYGKVVTLNVEGSYSGGQSTLAVGPDAFRYWDGEATMIPSEQQRKMFHNLKEALEFQDLKLLVESPLD